MAKFLSDAPLVSGFSKRHIESVFYKLFGCEPQVISQKVILSPVFSTRYFVENLAETRAKGRGLAISWVRGVVNKTDVTIMKSRWMGSTLGDIVILLGCSPCKTLVFCGSAASIRDEIEVGDFVIPSRAWIGEGFSRYYGCDSQNVSNECYDFSEPASKSKSLFCSVLANKLHVLFHEGELFTIGSLMAEHPQFIGILYDRGIDIIDMETSAVFTAARVAKIEAVAINIVSDRIPCSEFDIPFLHKGHRNLADKICPVCLSGIANLGL